MSTSAAPWRLVLDTNVVLDLLHFADAAALPIQQAIERHRARCYASQSTLTELSRVLSYSEFQLAAPAQTALLARYQLWVGDVQAVTVNRKLPRCSDPDDQMFLELAASVPADFLISKDKAVLAMKRHAALGFKILTPVEAAAFFASNASRLTSAASPALNQRGLRQTP